jgi:hypothetical protein
MPRGGAIIFRDLVGKLDVLNVECEKCGRRGRYHLHRLIERYGIDAKLFDWSDEITADCPRRQARNLNDQCAARCCSFKIIAPNSGARHDTLVLGGGLTYAPC